jgi:hypothetical protein
MTIGRNRAGWLFAAAAASLGSLYGCGGSDSDSPAPAPAPPPSPGASMLSALGGDMTRSMTRIGNLEAGTVLMFNAGSALSPNITQMPDATPGSPPNTFIHRGTYDGNGNGQD